MEKRGERVEEREGWHCDRTQRPQRPMSYFIGYYTAKWSVEKYYTYTYIYILAALKCTLDCFKENFARKKDTEEETDKQIIAVIQKSLKKRF